MKKKWVTISKLLVVSTIVRVVLIVYGEWQDKNMEVRYTDIDYIVFSDAASFMASGLSPYKRTTYRYSPLLALLLIPNSLAHRSFGKFLFSASDLVVGYLIYYILKRREVDEEKRLWGVMLWLFNPSTFTIGTRGNCEPLVCAIILWIIACLMDGSIIQAAFWYGLIVHFRIYPIIYSLPIVLILDPRFFDSCKKPSVVSWKLNQGETSTSLSNIGSSDVYSTKTALKSIFTRWRIMFTLVSGTVFILWTGLFYYLYGWEFLNEALLYHLTRTDPRHNFSIYFYHIYLHYGRSFSVVEKLISFLPQMIVQIALILCFAHDLPFCFFLQTVAFVALNKVITAQYFVWFFCLLPLIIPWSTMHLKWQGFQYTLLWVGAQTHWLFWGYLLEFKGQNVLLQLWCASIVFLTVNTFVLVKIIQHHRYTPLFKTFQHVSSKSTVKSD